MEKQIGIIKKNTFWDKKFIEFPTKHGNNTVETESLLKENTIVEFYIADPINDHPCSSDMSQYGVVTKQIMSFNINNEWISINERPLTQDDGEVMAFNKNWITPDFNQKGIRSGFIGGDGTFISAKWFDYQDTYLNNDDFMPSHYIIINPPHVRDYI